MSDWAIIQGMDYEVAGADEINSTGVTLTANASANIEGAYSQLIASTSRPATGIDLFFQSPSSNSASYLVDIAVGAAASEVQIIPNLLVVPTTNNGSPWNVFVPISIPTGSRLSARVQSSVGGATIVAHAVLRQEGSGSPSPLSRVTDYGTTAGSAGTTITSGAGGGKGSWAQLVASTTNRCTQLIVAVGNGITAPLGLLDVGVGAAASEVMVLQDLPTPGTVATQKGMSKFYGPFPLVIPAATRLSARLQVSTAGAQTLTVIAYGID